MVYRNVCLGLLCLLTACGGGGGGASDSAAKPVDTPRLAQTITSGGELFLADKKSPYAAILVGCVRAGHDSKFPLCKLSQLPLLGQQSSLPTKQEILARTLVTDQWMAERFAQLLDEMPSDIFRLFRGVTAVVISSAANPSFYTPITGVINLDPRFLQSSEDSAITVFNAAAFNDSNASVLSFRTLEANIDQFYSINSARYSSSVLPFADVLFHELAHANDFMPPALLSSINPSYTVIEQVDQNEANGVYANDVAKKIPLKSDILRGIAGVLFDAKTPTSEQKRYSPVQLAASFAADGANNLYNYHSDYEDVGMLFEEVMMKYHFNVDRAYAFTDVPVSANPTCNDYIVRWAMVGRIADPSVKPRAQLVVQKVLGITDASEYFKNLPEPQLLQTGIDMCASLHLSYPLL